MPSGTNSVIDEVKSGLKGIRGIGDSIRGNFNQAADRTFDSHSPEVDARNRAVAEKGEADIQRAEQVMNKHSNSHADSGIRTGGLDSTTTTAPTTTTGTTGAHSVAPGNLGSTGAATGTGVGHAGVVQEETGTTARY